MPDEISHRIEREIGRPGLVAAMGELAPADLNSLLIAVARRRAARTTPAEVLRRYRSDRLVRPAEGDGRRLDELEQQARRLLPADFEWLELSPLCPLGTSAALGGVSQDWVVTSFRGGEVVSDPTTVLALESAVRRRRDRSGIVRLVTGHRTLRAQRFEPPFSQHFRLLALAGAGRAGDEEQLVSEQVAFYVRFLERLTVGTVLVDRAPRKSSYYDGGTFGISVADTEVVEGGLVDWTQALLGDRKERLVVSGIGLDGVDRIVESTRR